MIYNQFDLPRKGVEFNAADVSLCFQCSDRMFAIEGPYLDSRIVTSAGQKLRVNSVKVDTPAALLVFLKDPQPSASCSVPNGNAALIV